MVGTALIDHSSSHRFQPTEEDPIDPPIVQAADGRDRIDHARGGTQLTKRPVAEIRIQIPQENGWLGQCQEHCKGRADLGVALLRFSPGGVGQQNVERLRTPQDIRREDVPRISVAIGQRNPPPVVDRQVAEQGVAEIIVIPLPDRRGKQPAAMELPSQQFRLVGLFPEPRPVDFVEPRDVQFAQSAGDPAQIPAVVDTGTPVDIPGADANRRGAGLGRSRIARNRDPFPPPVGTRRDACQTIPARIASSASTSQRQDRFLLLRLAKAVTLCPSSDGLVGGVGRCCSILFCSQSLFLTVRCDD